MFSIKTRFKVMGTLGRKKCRKNESHHKCDLHSCALFLQFNNDAVRYQVNGQKV